MERIKIFLQRLQEVYYSKHPKSAIDIDLMLDYTRVMYIDLLEWRKEFTDPIHSDIAAMMQANPATASSVAASEQVAANTSEQDIPENTENKTVAEPEAPMVSSAEATAVPAKAEEAPQPAVSEASEFSAQAEALTEEMQEEVDQTIKEDLPEAAPLQITPEVVHHYPEEENIEHISKERSGISFELPTQPERFIKVDEALVEEAPSETPVVEEIPAPTPKEIPLPEFKPYSAAKLFDGIVELKDIRTSIGINDKYLFLNELFNNHKSDYEETLDKINHFSNAAEAKDWVKTQASATKKWDNSDSTVQSFYALVDKHFTAK